MTAPVGGRGSTPAGGWGPFEARAQATAGATDLDALALIAEALDIPYAACAGDEAIRAKILDARILDTVIMLRSWLQDRAAGTFGDDHFAWRLGYLRERLAEHPATGYRTDYAEVLADWRARGTYRLPDAGSDGAQ